jgi:hypothetical protein
VENVASGRMVLVCLEQDLGVVFVISIFGLPTFSVRVSVASVSWVV